MTDSSGTPDSPPAEPTVPAVPAVPSYQPPPSYPPAPSYGPPPDYSAPPPAYQQPPPFAPPPAYEPPPAYGPPPGYGPPPAYSPPPAYGPPPGYGPLPGYGAPAGYGPPPGYGPQSPNYAAGTDDPAGYGAAAAFMQQRDRKRKRTRVMLAGAAVVVVVAAGTLVSFVAFRNENSGAGAATPQKAVAAVFADLANADLLGVLDDLPPAERNALRDSINDEVNQLKRLKVLDGSADVSKVSGVHFQATGLTYEPTDEVINSHARIVKVTGGILTISSDAGKVPYTKDFLGAAYPSGNAPTGSSTQRIDIAAEAAKEGGPLRIGVEKVDGSWYPSLMYTIVDSATRDDGAQAAPTAADSIPAQGARSSDDAALGVIKAAFAEDVPTLISLLDPNEDAALHDYGGLLDSGDDSGVSIDNATFTDTKVSGGIRVSLKSMSLTDPDGNEVVITISNDCIQSQANGKTEKYCSADLFDDLAGDVVLTADEKAALTHLFTALPNIGLVTTQAGGKWYVSPIRTFADIVPSVLSGLADNDLLTLIKLAQRTR